MEEVEEEPPAPMVRMANLCCISGFAINGVAAIHSEIVRTFTFKDFAELYPEKFQNKTNGVTPRRWLAFCNPQLSEVITEAIGTDEWVTDTALLEKLAPLAKDAELQKKWKDAKQERKALCAKLIEDSTGVKVSTDAMFDIQIKRIHEYKRQLPNIMGIIHCQRDEGHDPRGARERHASRLRLRRQGVRHLPAGEAHLCSSPRRRGREQRPRDRRPAQGCVRARLQRVPGRDVIPASELSQHISTAGTKLPARPT